MWYSEPSSRLFCVAFVLCGFILSCYKIKSVRLTFRNYWKYVKDFTLRRWIFFSQYCKTTWRRCNHRASLLATVVTRWYCLKSGSQLHGKEITLFAPWLWRLVLYLQYKIGTTVGTKATQRIVTSRLCERSVVLLNEGYCHGANDGCMLVIRRLGKPSETNFLRHRRTRVTTGVVVSTAISCDRSSTFTTNLYVLLMIKTDCALILDLPGTITR